MVRARRLLLPTALFCGAAIAAVYAWVGNPLDPFDDARFSPQAWATLSEADDLEGRARMCRNLIRRHLRAGTAEADVVALVGDPDDVNSGAGRGRSRQVGVKTFEYYLGSWPMQGMDDAFLYVHLDAGGRVVKAEVHGY